MYASNVRKSDRKLFIPADVSELLTRFGIVEKNRNK